MWFPYSLPVRWKAECERSCVGASLADPDEREFIISFLLHSRVTGEWGSRGSPRGAPMGDLRRAATDLQHRLLPE